MATSPTTYKYNAREILALIQKELGVPSKAISFTFSADGTYNITVDNSYVAIPRPSLPDPYDQYRDENGRLPPHMW
jgi:hypothetical protein